MNDLVGARLTSGLELLRAHDAAAILGDDPEHLHQARVATRRLRSDLRALHRFVESEWSRDLRQEIGWLGDRLGAVRDLDVLHARLEGRIETVPGRDERVARAIVRRLAGERTRARGALRTALRSVRYRRLLDRLEEAAREPRTTADADGTAGEAVKGLVRKRWRKLRDEVAALSDAPADVELHRVRIEAKRCRYVAETAATLEGKPARRFARAVEAVQTVLGEHQDAVVAAQWLRAFADAASPPEAFVAGELAAIEEAARRTAREQFGPVWRAAGDPQLRRWLHR
ncbi:MAG: CHAD domain-containing protein [Acidimicrobiia bacterium]